METKQSGSSAGWWRLNTRRVSAISGRSCSAVNLSQIDGQLCQAL